MFFAWLDSHQSSREFSNARAFFQNISGRPVAGTAQVAVAAGPSTCTRGAVGTQSRPGCAMTRNVRQIPLQCLLVSSVRLAGQEAQAITVRLGVLSPAKARTGLASPAFPPGNFLGETDKKNLRYHNQRCQARHSREATWQTQLQCLLVALDRPCQAEGLLRVPKQ